MLEDFEKEFGESCDLASNYPFNVNPDNTVTCGKPNNPKWATKPKNACKVALCELEDQFTREVAYLIDEGFALTIDNNFKNLSDRKYQQVCQKTQNQPNVEQKDQQCCGQGLNRRFYNAITHKCCDDKIAPFGAC